MPSWPFSWPCPSSVRANSNLRLSPPESQPSPHRSRAGNGPAHGPGNRQRRREGRPRLRPNGAAPARGGFGRHRQRAQPGVFPGPHERQELLPVSAPRRFVLLGAVCGGGLGISSVRPANGAYPPTPALTRRQSYQRDRSSRQNRQRDRAQAEHLRYFLLEKGRLQL